MWGEKDADGFYWGELRGRQGYVPHNMVSEVTDQGVLDQIGQSSATSRPQGAGPQQSMRGVSRDRWGDIYSNMPVKRLVALYDYDPQELSPNVDADVSLFRIKMFLKAILMKFQSNTTQPNLFYLLCNQEAPILKKEIVWTVENILLLLGMVFCWNTLGFY